MEVSPTTRSLAAARLWDVPATWSLHACIAATFLLRTSSFAAGVLLGLHLAYISINVERVGESLVGLLAATFYAVELVGAPFSGMLGDRIGHRPFLLVGPIAGAVAAQMLGFTTFIPLLFVMMAFKGISAATSIPATLAYLSYGTRDSDGLRTRTFAAFEVATVAGIGTGGFFGGIFSSLLGQWAFTAVAGMYVVALLLFLSIAKTDVPRGSVERRSLTDYRRLLRAPRFLRFIPAWICVNAIVGMWGNHGTFILAQADNPLQLLQGGYHGATVGGVFAGIGVAFGLGILIWGNILAGRPRTTGMFAGVLGMFTTVVLLALLNHSGNSWGAAQFVLLGLVALALMVASGFTPAALAHLADIAEEQGSDRGAVMGLYSVFFGVGQVSGAVLGGPFAQWLGADGLILLTGILTAAAYLSVRLLQAESRHPIPQPA